VFNESGQEIDVGGLVCLFDADGPCANAVKDSQRTKTSAATRRTFSVIWGCAGEEARLARAEAWYRSLLADAGVETEAVASGGAARLARHRSGRRPRAVLYSCAICRCA
jgi:hypothetical protein